MRIRDLSEKRVAAPNYGSVKSFAGIKEYVVELKDQGWNNLGGGSFGQVFTNDKFPDWVLKIFRDPAYLQFLSMSKKSNNPHFPRVGKVYRMWDSKNQNNFYGCMIERLDFSPGALETPVDYFDRTRTWMGDRMPPHLAQDFPQFVRLEKTWPKFREACKLIGKMIRISTRNNPKRAIQGDVNFYNMMMRGNCPVFTDPVYEPSQQWRHTKG